ncbi:hypothetical protein LFM09_19005 [Lentzea alba]|uniref:hypothetical protein n=1 Tax=Lentzea alba TaxID=2714351 RepID=UPI0039BF2C0E
MNALGKLLAPVPAAALMMTGVASAQASEVGVQHAACGVEGSFFDGGGEAGARIRTGSSTGCTGRGSIQPSHRLVYWCTTRGNDAEFWTYLFNYTTGVKGWTRNNLLPNFGSHHDCKI